MNKRKLSPIERKTIRAYKEYCIEIERLNDIRRSLEEELVKKLDKGEISYMEYIEKYFNINNLAHQVWKEQQMR